MDKQNKHQPRFGSDWDLDLGWILFWLIVFTAIVSAIGFGAWTSVQNNRGNVDRDRYYADHCKLVFVAEDVGKAYECQNK